MLVFKMSRKYILIHREPRLTLYRSFLEQSGPGKSDSLLLDLTKFPDLMAFVKAAMVSGDFIHLIAIQNRNNDLSLK